jgi:hypothetical protein
MGLYCYAFSHNKCLGKYKFPRALGRDADVIRDKIPISSFLTFRLIYSPIDFQYFPKYWSEVF